MGGRMPYSPCKKPHAPSREGSAEEWPSGLRRTLGKRVCGKPYRGFESHSLRHLSVQPVAVSSRFFQKIIYFNNLTPKAWGYFWGVSTNANGGIFPQLPESPMARD